MTTETFYQGQTDYIQKLNTLALANDILDVAEGLDQLDESVVAAAGSATSAAISAETATTQADIATTQAGISIAQTNIATTQAGTATTQAGIATTKAGEASTSAGTATTQAGIATTQADIATTKAAEAAASATALITTSPTDFTPGTGSFTFVVDTGKQFSNNVPVLAVDQTNPANFISGTITSYSGTSLQILSTSFGGSGVVSNWNISISGVRGAVGATGGVAGGSLTGAINENKGSDITTVASPDIWSNTGNLMSLVGPGTITGFSNAPQAGAKRTLFVTESMSITTGSSVIVYGAAPSTTIALVVGDYLDVTANTTTQFRVTIRKRDGTPVALPVAAAGVDASTTQIVRGDDTRLTDARSISLVGSSVGQIPIWNGSIWTVGSITPGLANFTESVNTASPNATIHVVQLTPNVASTNADIVMSPKGSGAILGNMPDSSTTGGNKRGSNAVDFQTTRNNANQVASGSTSVIVGGGSNKNSSDYGFVGGGTINSINSTATYHVIVGGSNNTIYTTGSNGFIGGGSDNQVQSGNFGTIVGGQSNFITANYGIIGGGIGNSAGGLCSIAGGWSNILTGTASSCVGGKNANDRGVSGSIVWSGFTGGANGQLQKADYLLAILTTNTTATVLTTDSGAVSSNNMLIMPDLSSYYITLRITARRSSDGATATWTGSALFTRQTGVATITRVNGTVTASFLTGGFTVGIPTITADTSTGSIKVTVVGVAATNIQWLCHLDTLQTTA
mgnify:CR=1 FL=1